MKGKATSGIPARIEIASRVLAMMLTSVQFDRSYYPLLAKDALAAADALLNAAQQGDEDEK